MKKNVNFVSSSLFLLTTKRLNHAKELVFCNALHSSSSNERDENVEKTRKRTKKKRIASCFSSLVVGRRRRSDDDDDINDDERKISKVLPRRRASVVPVHVAKLTGKVPHVRRTRDTVRERNVAR